MDFFRFLIFCLFFSLSVFPAFAGLQRFEESAIAYGGDNQSKNEVRQLALLEAKRQALEKAGTYVQSFTFVRNAQLEKDEILLFTAGVTQTKILKELFFVSPEGLLGVKVIAQIEIDSDVVEKEIQLFKQNQDIQQLYRQLLTRNKQLEQELKKLKLANQKTQRGEDLSREAMALDYVMRGVQAYQKGEEQEAIIQFSLALKEYPRQAIAYNNRGFIWMKKGFLTEAENDFNQAIACDSNFSAAWFNRAGLFWRKQESVKAINDLGRALDLEPKMARALYNRAYVYIQTGQFQNALHDLNQLLDLHPEDASNWALRADLFKREKKYALAEKDLYQALKLQVDSETYLLELSWIELMQKKFIAARIRLTGLIKKNPKLMNAYAYRGIVERNLKNYSQALMDQNRAIQLAGPQVPWALYYNRALIYAETKEYQAALADLQMCVRLAPNDAPTHFAIAEILKHQGLCAESLQYYQRACQLGLVVACGSQCP